MHLLFLLSCFLFMKESVVLVMVAGLLTRIVQLSWTVFSVFVHQMRCLLRQNTFIWLRAFCWIVEICNKFCPENSYLALNWRGMYWKFETVVFNALKRQASLILNGYYSVFVTIVTCYIFIILLQRIQKDLVLLFFAWFYWSENSWKLMNFPIFLYLAVLWYIFISCLMVLVIRWNLAIPRELLVVDFDKMDGLELQEFHWFWDWVFCKSSILRLSRGFCGAEEICLQLCFVEILSPSLSKSGVLSLSLIPVVFRMILWIVIMQHTFL